MPDFLFSFLYLFIYYGGRVGVHVLGMEVKGVPSTSIMWGSGIELRLSALMATTVTH